MRDRKWAFVCWMRAARKRAGEKAARGREVRRLAWKKSGEAAIRGRVGWKRWEVVRAEVRGGGRCNRECQYDRKGGRTVRTANRWWLRLRLRLWLWLWLRLWLLIQRTQGQTFDPWNRPEWIADQGPPWQVARDAESPARQGCEAQMRIGWRAV